MNIVVVVFRGMKIGLPYRMMLACIFKHLRVPLDNHTSLKLTPFDELTFKRMGDKTARST